MKEGIPNMPAVQEMQTPDDESSSTPRLERKRMIAQSVRIAGLVAGALRVLVPTQEAQAADVYQYMEDLDSLTAGTTLVFLDKRSLVAARHKVLDELVADAQELGLGYE